MKKRAKMGRRRPPSSGLRPPSPPGEGTAAGAGGRGPVVRSVPRSVPRPGVKFAELDSRQKAAFESPSGFGRLFLKIPLTDRQAAACDSFAPNGSHVSVLCCNEAGKTTKIMATVILWHLTVFPRRGENGGVTATSGSWSQITNQLMPALHSHSHRFPRWHFQDREIKRDGFPNFMAYSCAQPGRAEGFHGSLETPLLMLFDECKSVADGIIRAGEDRCRPQRMGLLSSPGFALGKFYASHTTEAAYWTRHKLTVDDCPWIDRDEMRRVITRAGGGDYERGLQDPFIRSAYFAEFMPFVEGGLISLSDIEECLADPPGARPGERHARLDFAAGGDENAIGMRVGNRVWIADAWRDKNTMSAVGRFIRGLEKLKADFGLRPEEVEGDADGNGRGMVDRIRECGWPILDYHANSQAFDPTKFRNRESENWYNGTETIRERKIVLPEDAELKGQLCDRLGKFESNGRRWIESKPDLFRRQARDGRPSRSPDRAEVILGAMARLPAVGSMAMQTGEPGRPEWMAGPDLGKPWRDDADEGMSVPEEVLRGFDAG